MSQQPGKFVWFEHRSNDIPSATAFYEELFGWRTDQMPMSDGQTYPVIMNGDAGIGGYAEVPNGTPNQWLSFLSVDDVDASYKAAVAAGAKSLMAPCDYGSAGRSATLADPTGGVFALWKGAQGDPPESTSPPAGGWLWNELTTQDDAAAVAFYEKVFGYVDDAKPMPQGTYHVLKQGDSMRAGVMKAMDASMPTMWLQYVAVADCDASSKKAQGLGAHIVVPPTDIPEIGRFAVFIDPLGAALAVMKPAAG